VIRSARAGYFLIQPEASFRRGRIGLPQLALVSLFSLIAVAGCAHRTYKTQSPAPTPVPQPIPSNQPPPSAPSGPPPPVERQPVVPGEYVEEGVASWYGIPFNGHRTSSGEIYDMHQFTAAHRTLPFNAVVRVTNLLNGRQTEVRINDRGPFVANRIIDLSLAAAQAIAIVGPGTAPVRLEVVSGPDPQVGFFGVQVGAFLARDNAERLKAQLETRYSPVTVAIFDFPGRRFYRVRVGQLPSEAAANQLADELQTAEQLTTFVVRLDE